MSNFDKIKDMTFEETAKWLYDNNLGCISCRNVDEADCSKKFCFDFTIEELADFLENNTRRCEFCAYANEPETTTYSNCFRKGCYEGRKDWLNSDIWEIEI